MTTLPTDPHVIEEGHAPTPFTADEIRRGCPRGRTIKLLSESDGEPPSLRLRRFVDVDEEGATVEHFSTRLDGQPLGVVERDRTTWRGLQAHASFPAALVEIEPETIRLELGVLDCLRYTVRDGPNVTTFWFSDAYPGMPVRVETAVDGRVTSSVTMIASELPRD